MNYLKYTITPKHTGYVVECNYESEPETEDRCRRTKDNICAFSDIGEATDFIKEQERLASSSKAQMLVGED